MQTLHKPVKIVVQEDMAPQPQKSIQIAQVLVLLVNILARGAPLVLIVQQESMDRRRAQEMPIVMGSVQLVLTVQYLG